MSSAPVVFYHSRPRARADWRCPRSRYYAYDFDGGIQKDNLTLDLFLGTCLHDGIAAIATQHRDLGKVDIDKIGDSLRGLVFTTITDYAKETTGSVSEDTRILANEKATLVEGLIRGFYRVRWPQLIAQYPTILAIEAATIYPHDVNGHSVDLDNLPALIFIYNSRPDLVLQGDLGTIYIEVKSTGSKKAEWIESWQTDIQVHATLRGIEFTLGEQPLGTIVQGLYKGSEYYGKFSSALVYGYVRRGNPPFTKSDYSAEYKYGMVKFPVWDYPGGSKAWIAQMSPEVLAEQFPQTPLIFPNEELIEGFFRQRAQREMTVREAVEHLEQFSSNKQAILDVHFPQNFDACTPAWGHGCDFVKICHGPAQNDPVGSGLYMVRDRSHEEEFDKLIRERLSL